MLLFWWTGRGYLTPLVVFGVLIVFGFILRGAAPLIPDAPWFWGVAIIVAGGVNWVVGRRQNARKLAAVRSTRLIDRLLYRARHKFMSLPIETWSIPLVIGGISAVGYGLVGG